MPRNTSLLLCLFILGSFVATAQHPLFGTWEMVSISGVNAEGAKFNLDTSAIHETKIITPTHYILIAMDKQDGTWTFNRCYFGSIRISGEKYYEIPIMSSETIYENVKTDFSWKVNGKEFIQSGVITRPDGKTIVLDRFQFTRSEVPEMANDPFIGTWQAEHEGVSSFFVATSTHWMVIEKKDKKFTKALGGVYNIKGKVAELNALYGTENATSLSAELHGQQITFNHHTYSRVK